MPGAETFRASAEAYDRHVGRYSPQLAAALTDFAGVEAGMRVLDVGCGTGALSAALAERLGESNVSAADPSDPFVQACRERLPGAQVVEAAAEELPFPDDAFDATLSQLVVNFLLDAEQGVREMARVAWEVNERVENIGARRLQTSRARREPRRVRRIRIDRHQ